METETVSSITLLHNNSTLHGLQHSSAYRYVSAWSSSVPCFILQQNVLLGPGVLPTYKLESLDPMSKTKLIPISNNKLEPFKKNQPFCNFISSPNPTVSPRVSCSNRSQYQKTSTPHEALQFSRTPIYSPCGPRVSYSCGKSQVETVNNASKKLIRPNNRINSRSLHRH